MSRRLGDMLTDDLMARFDPAQFRALSDRVLVLLSVDAAGRPHPAMVTHREATAKDPRNIRLALWKGSSTCRNLAERHGCTLVVVDAGLTYYIKGRADELRPTMDGLPYLTLFNLAVEEVLEDVEPEEPITSGITFRIKDREQYLSTGEEILKAALLP